MKKLGIRFLGTICLGILVFTMSTNVFARPNVNIEMFSKEEKDWINKHLSEPLIVGSSSDSSRVYPDSKGAYKGFGYEFFKLLSKETGLQFDYRLSDWMMIENEFENNELDILFGDNQSTIEEVSTNISEPIMEKKYWIGSYAYYQSMLDLSGKRIGFVKGDIAYDKFKEAYDVVIRPVYFDNDTDLLNNLFNKNIDAIFIVDCMKINGLMSNFNVDRNFEVNGLTSEITLKTSQENEMLIGIVNKIIATYKDEIQSLIEEGSINYIKDNLNITRSEQTNLNMMMNLKVGYLKNYIPYDYALENEIKGISAEIVTTIAQTLNLPLKYIPFESDYELEEALRNRTIDIASSVSYYHVPKEGFITSIPYSTTHIGTVGNKLNSVMAHQLYDLDGYRIALIKDSWQEELLKENKITYDPIYVENVHEALDKVEKNDADFAVDSLWTLSYLLKSMPYDYCRLTGEIEIDMSKHLMFNGDQQTLRNMSNRIIRMTNLEAVEQKGLGDFYQFEDAFRLFEVLTVLLFVLLCFIGIYIAFLINRLNIEKHKAESANRSKSEFLAKMSHEIRTPLTAIMGYINLLIKSQSITGKERKQLKIAYNSSNILIHLVNDILDFSKIEAGRVTLVEHPFNLRLMITNAINIIGVMAEEKKLDFVVKMQPNLPKYIIGDERRLEQILINILSNSVKFTEKGSVELAISSEYVNNQVRLNFKIIDTGKGMKSDTINTIFEAFQQEDNSISRKYGGTGLGLYISKEFIERMNGEIRVKSTVDMGTEFDFYTIHRITDGMKEENTVPVVTTMESLIGMKVLLVEDNDINQLIIRDILHEMGLKVVITNNGAEAMEIINSRFDFVLMDIQMPVMNGIMAIRLIKQREALKNLPIIALTANVMPEQIESYFAEGFDGYCSKPIMVNELVQTLTHMYEKYHKHK